MAAGGGYYHAQRDPAAAARLQQHAAAARAAAADAAARTQAFAADAAARAEATGRAYARAAGARAARLHAAARDAYEARVAPLVEALLRRVSGGGGGSDGPAAIGGGAGGWDAAEIAAILPPGRAWAELAEDVAERLRANSGAGGNGGAAGRKAVGLLLGCALTTDCAAAADALARLRGPPPGCSLLVDAHEISAQPRGAAAATLQARLAPFLRRCPTGLVVVAAAQLLPLEALPALHSALSELGGFQHGGRVDATRAAVALVVQLPSASEARALAGASDAADAARELKELYFDDVLGAAAGIDDDDGASDGDGDGGDSQAGAGGEEDRGRKYAPVVRALRRRFDFAAIARLSPAAAAEADREEERAAPVGNDDDDADADDFVEVDDEDGGEVFLDVVSPDEAAEADEE